MDIRTIYSAAIVASLLLTSSRVAALEPIDVPYGDQLWVCTHNGNAYAIVEGGEECPEFMFSFTLPHAVSHFGINPPSDWLNQLMDMKIDDPDECVFGRHLR